MTIIEKFYNFLNTIVLRITGKEIGNIGTQALLPNLSEDQTLSAEGSNAENVSEELLEERINVAKRTLMTKLYMLEQEIAVFEEEFPKEYNSFLQRIEMLRDSYNSSLEEIQKLLTFEIDPESDTSKIDEVVRLEHEIKEFLEKTVKFHVISKRLQRLIKKLNILYNVSLSHSRECDKEKVRMQLENAIQLEKKIAEEIKAANHILFDNQLKERIIDLLSYVDYEIFKCSIRNSSQTPMNILSRLVLSESFDDFDYDSAFTAFIKDELSDLTELIPLIKNFDCIPIKMKSKSIFTELTYAENASKKFLDHDFWNRFLEFESTVIEMLKLSDVEKDKIKVKLISRMDVNVDENEVLVLPITSTCIALTSLFATTHDNRILLLIKFLKNLSKDITYKEIYFLLQLFDVIGVIKNTPNDLIIHVQKYIEEYPYTPKIIMEKKQEVFEVPNKKYVVAFSLSDFTDETVKALESLNLDFKIENDNVLVNSFYFNGLKNVLSSVQKNTDFGIGSSQNNTNNA